MKMSKLAIALAVAGLLTGAQASAQQPSTSRQYPSTQQSEGARQIAYEYESYYAEAPTLADDGVPSPSDEPLDDAPQQTGGSPGATGGSSYRYVEEVLDEPFRLFDMPLLNRMGVNVGGWMANSYTFNPYRPVDRFNGPLTWTDRSNEFQMNEIWLYAGRDTDTGGSGWDIGGRIDTMYGTNYRWNTSAGLESKWNSGGFYGLALPAAYAEIAYNDLKVKVGHFITPIGYYTLGTYNNFFNTLPYTFQYGEPFTHTGMLGTYQVTDNLALGAGIVRGWDNFDNSSTPNLSYLGTATLSGDSGDSLAFSHIYGREPNLSGIGNGHSTRYMQSLVYSRPLTDTVTAVLQSDFGLQGDATLYGKTARWYGLNSYLYYTANAFWSWGVNSEWFRDEDGFRVGGVLPSGGSPNARGMTRGGFAGNFYAVTVGPRWTPLPNLVVRPNFRWDMYDGKLNDAGQRPFDDGSKRHQEVLATDVIITF